MYNPHELFHYGVIGQKWGRRRYQNEDGTLTPLGKVHYGYQLSDGTTQARKAKSGRRVIDVDFTEVRDDEPSGKNKKKPTIGDIDKARKEYDSITKGARKISERHKSRRQPDIDVSNISDEEMRRVVQRANLEKQYIQAISGPSTKSGRAKAFDILDDVGDVLAISISALTLAAMIKTKFLK